MVGKLMWMKGEASWYLVATGGEIKLASRKQNEGFMHNVATFKCLKMLNPQVKIVLKILSYSLE